RPERTLRNGRPDGIGRAEPARPVRRILAVGVNKGVLEQAIRDSGVSAVITDDVDDADVVFTLPSFWKRKPQKLRDAEERNLEMHVLKSNGASRIMQALASLRSPAREGNPVMRVMEQTEEAIGPLLTGERHQIDLEPQSSYIRRIQHQIAQQFNLGSRSHGREPNRRVRVFRDGDDTPSFEE
ncbi:MAG: R3H domain-containing nucleic acid-binding protein, partial [Dehalococcoidia bacterium]